MCPWHQSGRRDRPFGVWGPVYPMRRVGLRSVAWGHLCCGWRLADDLWFVLGGNVKPFDGSGPLGDGLRLVARTGKARLSKTVGLMIDHTSIASSLRWRAAGGQLSDFVSCEGDRGYRGPPVHGG